MRKGELRERELQWESAEHFIRKTVRAPNDKCNARRTLNSETVYECGECSRGVFFAVLIEKYYPIIALKCLEELYAFPP